MYSFTRIIYTQVFVRTEIHVKIAATNVYLCTKYVLFVLLWNDMVNVIATIESP